MSLLNNDLNIFYSGGSGGFYLLHYLLLFRQHWCALDLPTAAEHSCTDQDFDSKLKSIIDHQWSIPTTSKWKQNEVWPDNSVTLAQAAPRPYKVFLTCMTPYPGSWPDLPGKKVLLYTDINSQIRLAAAKKAIWFRDGKRLSKTQIKKFIQQAFAANNHKIYHRLQPYFDTADYTICLQDLMARPELVLGAAVTDQHRQFTQHWKNCHPVSLLEKTGLN